MVHHAVMPNGKSIKLLKTLLTSACERNCYYCPFRAGRDFRRATLKPDEMALTFMNLHQAGVVEGLFLSSGIIGGGLKTQDKIIATAEILRWKYHYKGYVHLKVMPGAERSQVEQAMLLADRVSINLEAPNTERLSRLAPRKEFMEELLQPLKWIEEIRRTEAPQNAWNNHWPSSVTQFVVGAAGESDLELLLTTDYLYRNLRLKRAYYSKFNPIEGTPLEGLPPAPPLREHRLYQASFLIRDYGFSIEELPFSQDGNLPGAQDPKLAWAEINLKNCPIEINRADRQELMRVPGIGPKNAMAILITRRRNPFRTLRSRRIGITSKASFILISGRQPSHQISMF
jgi:predicted DNA-binding helix-hairpin-helix protein